MKRGLPQLVQGRWRGQRRRWWERAVASSSPGGVSPSWQPANLAALMPGRWPMGGGGGVGGCGRKASHGRWKFCNCPRGLSAAQELIKPFVVEEGALDVSRRLSSERKSSTRGNIIRQIGLDGANFVLRCRTIYKTHTEGAKSASYHLCAIGQVE